MKKLLRRSAPIGLMAALTLWCCWTQLRDVKPLIAATNDEKLPRIERDALRPNISEVSQRDPFLQFKPEPVETEAGADQVAQPVVPEEPSVDPRIVARSLKLGATVMGANRLSVINGQVYTEGQLIALESFPGVRIELRQIRANGVLVDINAEEIEVKHGDVMVAAPAPTAAEPKLPSLKELAELLGAVQSQNNFPSDDPDSEQASGEDGSTVEPTAVPATTPALVRELFQP